MPYKLLIVEDDVSFGLILDSWAKKNHFDVVLVSGLEQAKKALKENDFNLVLSDLRLPDGDGIALLNWINEQKIALPVIIMTSYAEIQSAVSAMKFDAFDYLEKPINPAVLKQKIDQALDLHQAAIPIAKTLGTRKEKMIQGQSRASKQMYEHIGIVAPTRMSVLIRGESGTGKEYAAKTIHDMSTRREAPFIAVDCGALSKELAPSELFGHLKGSFTSAVSDKKGVFEQAKGGTVFLDEVGNLSYEVQVQLLRALQELKVRPVGSATDIDIDVRIIVATNENLEKAINDGRFREDLYHRLNEFSLKVPSLRERSEDIEFFAEHFLDQANDELDKSVSGFSREAIALLKKHQWSGNLRELRNVIRRSVLFAQSDHIKPEDLPDFISESVEEVFLESFEENEKERIERALKKAKGNKTLAARLLNIDRKTLYNKMHQYNMEI